MEQVWDSKRKGTYNRGKNKIKRTNQRKALIKRLEEIKVNGNLTKKIADNFKRKISKCG